MVTESSFFIFETVNDAHGSLSQMIVSVAFLISKWGKKNIEKKRKIQEETSRLFHAHIVHETIAFFSYLFLLPRLYFTRGTNSP